MTVADAILNYNRSVAKGDWKEAVSSLLNAIENETCEIRLGTDWFELAREICQ